MKGYLTLLVLIFHLSSYGQQLKPAYDPNYIVVKIDENNTRKSQKPGFNFDFDNFSKDYSLNSVKPIIGQKSRSSRNSVLHGIYKVQFNKPQDIEKIIRSIEGYPNVIYAEPVYLDSPLQIPNDPNANPSSGQQYHLTNISAYDAWDITTSDTTVTIGILDTGYDPDHEDLQNIQYNYEDPINGIDDDGNGYVDDFIGWDFADNDNEPYADQSDHGSIVAGVSSAETNNALGIAGVGYSSRFVPIKIFQSSNGFSSNAYEAIVYAADMGYDVINLSWGSIDTYTQYRQDIINYAVLEKDVVVIAAAGNTDENLNFYPASYDNVISVAASDQNDNKTDFSTYGPHVDLVAPGIDIYSTKNGSYSTDFGTSFASPMVAGAAALLRHQYPDWSASQVMEQLRASSDNVYNTGNNSDYDSLLGKGRLNVLEALTNTATHSVRLTDLILDNGSGEYAYFGDSISLTAGFLSYLSNLNDVTINISSSSEYVNFIDNELSFSSLDSLSEMVTDEIQFVLSEETPTNERLLFKIEYSSSDGYTDFEFFEFDTSPENIDFGEGNSQITVLPNGSLGYDDNDIDAGVGYSYNGQKLLEKTGLIVGLSEDSLVDNSVIAHSLSARSFDFETQDNLKFYKHPAADLHIASTFNDNASDNSILNLQIEQRFYAWNEGLSASNIISEYRVTNTGSIDYDSLYFGLMSDWDLNDSTLNASGWDFDLNLGFMTDQDSSIFVGISLLTDQSFNHQALDITNDDGSFLDDSTKFALISSTDTIALTNANITQTNSALITSLTSNSTEKVAFVLSAAETYDELISQIEQARTDYDEITTSPRFTDYDNVCEFSSQYLNPNRGTNHNFYSDNLATNLIGTGDSLEVGPITSDSAFYIVNVDSSYQSDIYAYQITAKSALAEFEMSTDTVFLDDTPTNEVFFTDLSNDAISWHWELGNGTFTKIQNPSNAYNQAGEYEISLIIETSFGCIDTLFQELVVVERNEIPQINDITTCSGTSVDLSATNTDLIRVFADSLATDYLFEGETFTTPEIYTDTLFYLSNASSGIESLRVPVEILVSNIDIQYQIIPDTTILDSLSILLINETADTESLEWFINNNPIGTLNNQPFTLTNNEDFNLTLTVQNDLGCEENTQETISLTSSQTPSVANQLVCQHSEVLIRPNNGNYFLFYNSTDKSELIAKGSQLLLDSIQTDTTIFVAGIDNIVPSTLASLEITLIDFEVDIQTTPDSIILDGPKSVTLSSSNTDIITYNWHLNGSLISIDPDPTLFFETAGEYEITLIAQNEETCTDHKTTIYRVIEEEIITKVDVESNESLIFPNPAKKHINIAKGYRILKIITSTGKEKGINLSDTGTVNLESLSPGVYYIFLTLGNKVTTQKLIISR